MTESIENIAPLDGVEVNVDCKRGATSHCEDGQPSRGCLCVDESGKCQAERPKRSALRIRESLLTGEANRLNKAAGECKDNYCRCNYDTYLPSMTKCCWAP